VACAVVLQTPFNEVSFDNILRWMQPASLQIILPAVYSTIRICVSFIALTHIFVAPNISLALLRLPKAGLLHGFQRNVQECGPHSNYVTLRTALIQSAYC